MNFKWMMGLLLLLLPGTVQAGSAVWVVPAEVKVRKLDPVAPRSSYVWSPSERVIRLAGAGREHAFFQVVVSCERDTLRDVELEWGPLDSPSGRIGADRIKAYLAALVKVYAKSGRAGRTGWYPDPLPPLSGPVDIYPDRHESRKNQPFWVEIAIPARQAPGKYSGRIAVKSAGRKLAEFPVELTVRGFTLPKSFHQFALFHCSRKRLEEYYTAEMLGGRTVDEVLAQYFDFMLERGIQPWINPFLQPECEDKGDHLKITWPDKKWERHFLSHPAYKRVTFSAAPDFMERLPRKKRFTPEFNAKIKEWVGAIYKHYKKNGWEDKLSFFGPLDEPNTLADYRELIKWGKLVRSVEPGISFQVTEQPIPQDPAWPPLTIVANDWVVHGSYLESNRDTLVRRMAAGDHACWYISCDQRYPMPNYFIDRTGVDPRAVPWITYRYHLQGILYWAVSFWREVKSPWIDPVTWKRSECNAPLAGEGSLLYPGEEIESRCGLKNVMGPISSIRFELLRKGLEDVEYLYRLVELGKESEAERLAMELVISVYTFSRDPGRYEKVKAEAARLIVAAAKKK